MVVVVGRESPLQSSNNEWKFGIRQVFQVWRVVEVGGADRQQYAVMGGGCSLGLSRDYDVIVQDRWSQEF